MADVSYSVSDFGAAIGGILPLCVAMHKDNVGNVAQPEDRLQAVGDSVSGWIG